MCNFSVKHNFVSSLGLILLIILLQACEYQPTGFFDVPVQQDKLPPEIQDINLDLTKDTIYLITDQTFHFMFTSSDQAIKSVAWLIDGEIKEIINNDLGKFTLNYGRFAPGTYDLGIRVFTGSGTGSIAEHLDMEGFVFEKHWVVIVVDDYERIATSSIENGHMRLDWEQCPANNLQKYQIIRLGKNYFPYIIGVSSSNFFIDNSYIGEGAEYIINAVLQSGETVRWSYCKLNRDMPLLKGYADKQNNFSVTWNNVKYYANLEGTTLYQKMKTESSFSAIFSSQSPIDSIAEAGSFQFGTEIDYYLDLHPNPYSSEYVPEDYNRSRVYATLAAGYQFTYSIDDDQKLIKAEGSEIIFSSPGNGLTRYSLQSMKIKDVYKYSSSTGDITMFENLCSSAGGKCFSCDAMMKDVTITGFSGNFGSASAVDLTNLSGNWSIRKPVSDNYIGLVNGLGSGIYLYNFNTHLVLDEYTLNPTTSYGYAISSSAKYFVISDQGFHLVKYDNYAFTELKLLTPVSVNFMEFCKTKNEQIAFWDGSTFQIILCEDQSQLASFSLTDSRIYSIDYDNQMILSAASGKLLVRSLKDGSLIREIPVNPQNLGSSDSYILSDHMIISSLGIIYFL